MPVGHYFTQSIQILGFSHITDEVTEAWRGEFMCLEIRSLSLSPWGLGGFTLVADLTAVETVPLAVWLHNVPLRFLPHCLLVPHCLLAPRCHPVSGPGQCCFTDEEGDLGLPRASQRRGYTRAGW